MIVTGKWRTGARKEEKYNKRGEKGSKRKIKKEQNDLTVESTATNQHGGGVFVKRKTFQAKSRFLNWKQRFRLNALNEQSRIFRKWREVLSKEKGKDCEKEIWDAENVKLNEIKRNDKLTDWNLFWLSARNGKWLWLQRLQKQGKSRWKAKRNGSYLI